MLSPLISRIKSEKVLLISAGCALITMFFVSPDFNYVNYIDLRVLCLLLCLMAVVSGFQHCGAFCWLTNQLLRFSHSGRVLGLLLILLPFFISMLVTNDVALLTFVPFTLLLVKQIGCKKATIPLLVLQTAAANLGSMATPVGNPQNLFLYARYNLTAPEFFSVTLPLTLVSLAGLSIASLFVLPGELPSLQAAQQVRPKKALIVYVVLFFLCLLTVFRLLPYWLVTLIVLLTVFRLNRSLLKGLDYGLLATFICFFIVSGNLGRMEPVRDVLRFFLQQNTLLAAAGASQLISNVPAAVLLSNFTDNWIPLLQGVNIGGLGTPIASLASLITLKQYFTEQDAKPGCYLAVFTAVNAAALTILLLLAPFLQ